MVKPAGPVGGIYTSPGGQRGAHAPVASSHLSMDRQRTPAQRSFGGAGGAGGGAGDEEAAPLSSPGAFFAHAAQIIMARERRTELRRAGRRMAARASPQGPGRASSRRP